MITNNEAIYKDVNQDGIFNAYFESNSSLFGLRQSQTIGGGETNTVSGHYSVIGGGKNNINNGYTATIAGGLSNTAIGNFTSILGGKSNLATGNYSIVLGGSGNYALADNSTVLAGKCARISQNHYGATVIGDGQDRKHSSNGSNTLTLDFYNGVYMTGSIFLDGVDVTDNIKNLGGKFKTFSNDLNQNLTGVFV
jgi:hypothetical protein